MSKFYFPKDTNFLAIKIDYLKKQSCARKLNMVGTANGSLKFQYAQDMHCLMGNESSKFVIQVTMFQWSCSCCHVLTYISCPSFTFLVK